MDQPTVLRTVAAINPPILMRKNLSNQSLIGNDQYEGYMIDLLNEIAKIVQFNFTIYEAPDAAYGSKDKNGEWNGMIEEIISKKADLIAAPLTITGERNEILSLTVAFMHDGLSILFKRPEEKDPSLFSVLSPLSLEVWLCILAAFVVVSLAFMIQDRISPGERQSPSINSGVDQHKFDLRNSLWFTASTLLQQGADIQPRAVSTRMLAGVWWFFTIIIVSCYTANLTAFLTVKRMVSPIESVEDLAHQTKIKYGFLQHSSTMAFFKESKIPTYKKMWADMQATKPSVFVKTNEDGIRRVKQGDYAFIINTLSLEYNIERDCSLIQIGGPLNTWGEGMAFQNGSHYVQPVNEALLFLQDTGVLDELKYKWWKENGGGQCLEKSTVDGITNQLGLPSVSGAFIILLFGIIVCFSVSALERVFEPCGKKSAQYVNKITSGRRSTY